MKIYHHLNEFKKLKNAIVTIGTFDGVHLGHQQIINTLKKKAAETGGETVILTFFPHPRMILHPEDERIKLITTMQEKATLLEGFGIDHLIITPFTRDFSNLSPDEYIKNILVDTIGTQKIVIGYDHRFGKDREGGLQELIKLSTIFGFGVDEIPEQDVHDVAVSSTRIRQALLAGDIADANDFMGHFFTLNGKVVRGDQIGRQLGYPTANLFIEESYKLIPADGIYAVTVKLLSGTIAENNQKGPLKAGFLNQDKIFKGMAYIGHRPTINGMHRNIEVNIFDFDDDIYDKNIQLKFHAFIRNDIKFENLDQLKIQLGVDKEAVLKNL